jgi:hypothetical protein
MTEAQASADDGERPKTPESVGAVSKLSLSDLYIQAYTNMRATDEISLKLLAAIPFVSGVGILLLVRKPTEASLFGREIDIPGRTVAEEQAEHVVTDYGHAHHDWQVGLAHTLNATPAARWPAAAHSAGPVPSWP